MISDEAVEAAAKVIALSTGHIMESDWEWEHLPKESYYKTAREALEAAAPHIQAATLLAAADEFDARLPDGTGNGRAYNSYQVAQNLRARATNPYRGQS